MLCFNWQWTTSWIWQRWVWLLPTFEIPFGGENFAILRCRRPWDCRFTGWGCWCPPTRDGFGFALSTMQTTATRHLCFWHPSWSRLQQEDRQRQHRCMQLWPGLCLAWVLTYRSPIGSLSHLSSMQLPTQDVKPLNSSLGSLQIFWGFWRRPRGLIKSSWLWSLWQRLDVYDGNTFKGRSTCKITRPGPRWDVPKERLGSGAADQPTPGRCQRWCFVAAACSRSSVVFGSMRLWLTPSIWFQPWSFILVTSGRSQSRQLFGARERCLVGATSNFFVAPWWSVVWIRHKPNVPRSTAFVVASPRWRTHFAFLHQTCRPLEIGSRFLKEVAVMARRSLGDPCRWEFCTQEAESIGRLRWSCGVLPASSSCWWRSSQRLRWPRMGSSSWILEMAWVCGWPCFHSGGCGSTCWGTTAAFGDWRGGEAPWSWVSHHACEQCGLFGWIWGSVSIGLWQLSWWWGSGWRLGRPFDGRGYGLVRSGAQGASDSGRTWRWTSRPLVSWECLRSRPPKEGIWIHCDPADWVLSEVPWSVAAIDVLGARWPLRVDPLSRYENMRGAPIMFFPCLNTNFLLRQNFYC